jgi:hypothetical protein
MMIYLPFREGRYSQEHRVAKWGWGNVIPTRVTFRWILRKQRGQVALRASTVETASILPQPPLSSLPWDSVPPTFCLLATPPRPKMSYFELVCSAALFLRRSDSAIIGRSSHWRLLIQEAGLQESVFGQGTP